MHPSRDDLAGLVFGTLAVDQVDGVADHVEKCRACEETMQELETASNEVLSALRGPREMTHYEQESDCRNLLAVVAAIGHEPSVRAHHEAAPTADDLGTVRDYQLQAKLGQGGMGTVYKALHLQLEKIVALKVLPSGRMKDGQAVNRFRREMKAVGRLSHQNIVGAHDAGEHEGTHYLVMEYVDGVDLSELVHRLGPLSIADACELVRQAAIGLQHAHEHSLVHRDIKPSNLMITKDGQLKILDLGLARLHNGLHGELTSTGQMMGTIDYMAPEQTGDSHDVDIRADIYGLGATLFKLLCNRAPYADERLDTMIRKLNALATQPVPAIREHREEVSEELAAIVTKMLAKEASDRYTTPQEVAEALEAFATGCDLSALVASYEQCGTEDDATAQPSIGSTRQYLTAPMTETTSTKDDEPQPPVVAGLPTEPPGPTAGLNDLGTPTVATRSRSVDPHPTERPSTVRAKPVASNRGTKIIATLLGLAALFAALTTIVIQTDKGDIKVVSFDPAIEVTIRRNGAVVDGFEVKQREDATSYFSGEYEIEIKGGKPDGVSITNEQFKLTRGKDVIVEIIREQQVASAQPSEVASAEQNPAPQVAKWQPGSAENVLPGIVPRPAELPGIRGWQLETTAPRTIVKCVDWSRDGQSIVAGSRAGQVRVYDAKTLTCQQILPGNWCNSVAWSRDGTRLVTTGTIDLDGATYPAAIRNRDGRSIGLTKAGILEGAGDAVWSPDDSQVAISGYWVTSTGYVGRISIWNSDGKFIRAFDSDPATEVAWSSDGALIAAGTSTGKVSIWTVEGESLAMIDAHGDYVAGLSWSPDSQSLASTSNDRATKIWSRDGTLRSTFQNPFNANCNELAWSPDGRSLAVATVGGIHILNADDTLEKTVAGDAGNNFSITWSPDSNRIATGGDHGLLVRDVAGDNHNKLTNSPEGPRVAWSPDSNHLAIIPGGDGLKTAYLLVPDGRFERTIGGDFGYGFPEWNPDGTRIVSGWTEGGVGEILNAAPQGSAIEPPVHISPAGCTVWNPQGTELAAVWDRESEALIRFWDRDGQPTSTIKLPSKASQLAWHPKGELLAAGAFSEIHLVRRDGTVEKTIPDHGSAFDLAWSPDGEWLATANGSTHISRLIRKDGELGPTLSVHANTVGWSADSRHVAVGVYGRLVDVWDLGGNRVRSLSGHDAKVISLSWSSDGRNLTSSGNDSTVINWNADTGEPEWTHVLLGKDQTASFTAAGQIIDGDPQVIEERFVYIVELEDGRLQTLKPSEFQKLINQPLQYDPAPPAGAAERDRAVAEWMLQKGCNYVNITYDGSIGDGEVTKIEQLPNHEFQLWGINAHNRPSFDDAAIEQLVSLRHLRNINLALTGITDAGLRKLAGVETLERLILGGTKISNSGLKYLSELRNLSNIGLLNTQITDDGLAHLHGSMSLRSIQLDGAKVTEAGITALSKALPNCRIEWDGGVIEPTMSADRAVAEWVLSIGGTVKVMTADETIDVAAPDQLPAADFALITVLLQDNKEVTDHDLNRFSGLRHLANLYLRGADIGDAAILSLKDLPELTVLGLGSTRITSEGLTNLDRFPGLIALHVPHTQIDDRAMESIGKVRLLQSLYISETRCTAAGLRQLHELDQLTQLTIGNHTRRDDFSDSMVEQFAGIENLSSLTIAGSRLTDEGLDNLVRLLPHLHSLGIDKSDLTDEGVKHLKSLPKLLGHLNLNHNNLTDASIEHLKQLQAGAFTVQGTKITAKGIEELQKARPKATIKWDGGTIGPQGNAGGAAEGTE